MSSAEESLGGGEPDELDSLLLGILHLALRAGHVGAVAAVEAFDRPGALAHGGAHAIHRRVAAADHDDIPARGIERAVVEQGHRVAQPLAVAGGEKIERGNDIAETDAGGRDVARSVDAGRDEERVMARAQLGEARVAPDLELEMERDAALAQQSVAPLDHALLQLEVGNAVDEQTADAVVAVIDMDLVALAAKLFRRGKPARARAEDADRLPELARRPRRAHPAAREGILGDEFLDRPDGDRIEALLDDAIAFAEPVLRADAAADLGHVVGRGGDLVGLLEPALGRQHQPIGDVVMQRAMDLAEGHAALRAAARLLGRAGGVEILVDLAEIHPPRRRVALLGRALRDGGEFEQIMRHGARPAPAIHSAASPLPGSRKTAISHKY